MLKVIYSILSVWNKVAMKYDLSDQVLECQSLMMRLREKGI